MLGLPTGLAFGISGVTFQPMLRNPLALPESSGTAREQAPPRVIGIVTLGLDDSDVSLMALDGAPLTALGMYLLAGRGEPVHEWSSVLPIRVRPREEWTRRGVA